MFDAESANFVCDFLECLRVPDGHGAGDTMQLMAWQRELVTEFYGTMDARGMRQYKYLYLEIGKKNGKSCLASGLGLYHTFADGEQNGEVLVCATDRANAGVVFDASLYMLETCPPLKKRARVIESQKIIRDKVSGTVYRVISAEAYSKHGYKPSCVIFDELHAQPNRKLWDMLTFGAGASRAQPVWIVLTTAGDDPDRHSVGWEVHERAQRILKARSGDTQCVDNPIWLPVIYSYEGDDIYNEENWYKANPGLGHTLDIETIRQEAFDAQQTQAVERLFRWLRLNQWLSVKHSGWLPLTLWDETENPFDEAELDGMKCFLGLDLASTGDLTAMTAVFPPQGELRRWRAIFRAWLPEERLREKEAEDKVPYSEWVRVGKLRMTEGDCVDYARVREEIDRMRGRYRVLGLGTDPWNSRMLTQELMRSGLEVLEIQQNVAGMSPAMKDLEILLRRGEMEHEPTPLGRWCFGNVRVYVDGNENLKPMKNLSVDRIDVTVSWIIAVAIARTKMDMRPNVYERRGPRFIELG